MKDVNIRFTFVDTVSCRRDQICWSPSLQMMALEPDQRQRKLERRQARTRYETNGFPWGSASIAQQTPWNWILCLVLNLPSDWANQTLAFRDVVRVPHRYSDGGHCLWVELVGSILRLQLLCQVLHRVRCCCGWVGIVGVGSYIM